MPQNIFKNMVKQKTCVAGLKYLKLQQSKGEKASSIIYESLELQDYLKPCSNLKLEEQRSIFSLRSRMNELKSNFSRNKTLKIEYCLNICGMEIDNEHMTWCPHINTTNDYKYINLLNGTLRDKIETFKQINKNQIKRKEDSNTL